jgi:hypothetical protein
MHERSVDKKETSKFKTTSNTQTALTNSKDMQTGRKTVYVRAHRGARTRPAFPSICFEAKTIGCQKNMNRLGLRTQ